MCVFLIFVKDIPVDGQVVAFTVCVLIEWGVMKLADIHK